MYSTYMYSEMSRARQSNYNNVVCGAEFRCGLVRAARPPGVSVCGVCEYVDCGVLDTSGLLHDIILTGWALPR